MDKFTRNKWQKGYRQHQYGDPTYLSFFLMFDWGGSPLFNGAAEYFLREVLFEPERADKLARFTKLLQKLNREMPWYFYEIEGFENVYKFDSLKEAYRGTDDGIKIKTIETLDLMIAGLMDMYRDIAFDIDRWCEVLPHNMTYFNLTIIISDCRTIANRKLNTNKNQTNDFQNEEREYTVINQDIADSAKAHFAVQLGKCSFTTDSGVGIFGGLSTSEPKIAENEIQIKYQKVKYYSKQYLNEFEGTLVENKLSEVGSNTPNTAGNNENTTSPSSEGDRISGKEESGAKSNNDTTGVTYTGTNVERIEGFGESENTENPINFGTPGGLGENLLSDAVAALEGAGERLTQDVLAKLLLGNVYGLNAASNIQDALAAGSLNGLRNLAVKTAQALTDDSQGNSNIGSSVGDNVFPETFPEVPLKPENMITPSDPEKQLKPENMITPSDPEKPLASANMITPSSPERPLKPENMITPSDPETLLKPENIITPSDPEIPLAKSNIKTSARVQREKPLPRTNIYVNESGNEG